MSEAPISPESNPSPSPLDEVQMDPAFFASIRAEVLDGDLSFITDAYLKNSHNLTEQEAAAVLAELQEEGVVAKDATGNSGYGIFPEGIESRELTSRDKIRLSKLGRAVLKPAVQTRQYVRHNVVSRPKRYGIDPTKKILGAITGSTAREEREAADRADKKVDEKWQASRTTKLDLTPPTDNDESGAMRAAAEKERRARIRLEQDALEREQREAQRSKGRGKKELRDEFIPRSGLDTTTLDNLSNKVASILAERLPEYRDEEAGADEKITDDKGKTKLTKEAVEKISNPIILAHIIPLVEQEFGLKQDDSDSTEFDQKVQEVFKDYIFYRDHLSGLKKRN